MFKVISANINGIRSAEKKGFISWLEQEQANIVCLQEVRAHAEQLNSQHFLTDYDCYLQSAQRKGYSGVAIYCKSTPQTVCYELKHQLADFEGRYIHVEYDDLIIASIYILSGTSGDERQHIKYEFMDFFYNTLNSYLRSGKKYILCGDWNIAHKKIDIKNWQANQKNSGFLPKERAWLDNIIALGYVDAFRHINKQEHEYSWWSNRGRARQNNVGWRIDYQFVTPNLVNNIQHAYIYREQNFSDHAPVIVEYDINI